MGKNDPDTWMWERAQALLEEADRMTRRFGTRGPGRGARTSWEPPVDMFETEFDLWILVALPGVTLEGTSVTVDGGALVVAGARFLPRHLRAAALIRMEIPHSRFERRVELPRGRYQIVGTELELGCLSIRLRKVL